MLAVINTAHDNGNGEKVISKIISLHPGAVGAASMDVINGSQLFATNTHIDEVRDQTSGADLWKSEGALAFGGR